MKHFFIALFIFVFGFAFFGIGKAQAIPNPLQSVCETAANPSSSSTPSPTTTSASAPAPSVCNTSTLDPISGKNGIILKAADLISAVAGVAAVVMIIYGGMQIVMSNGDSQKVAEARKTIIYAAIGIVVLILAQPILGFILSKV